MTGRIVPQRVHRGDLRWTQLPHERHRRHRNGFSGCAQAASGDPNDEGRIPPAPLPTLCAARGGAAQRTWERHRGRQARRGAIGPPLPRPRHPAQATSRSPYEDQARTLAAPHLPASSESAPDLHPERSAGGPFRQTPLGAVGPGTRSGPYRTKRRRVPAVAAGRSPQGDQSKPRMALCVQPRAGAVPGGMRAWAEGEKAAPRSGGGKDGHLPDRRSRLRPSRRRLLRYGRQPSHR